MSTNCVIRVNHIIGENGANSYIISNIESCGQGVEYLLLDQYVRPLGVVQALKKNVEIDLSEPQCNPFQALIYDSFGKQQCIAEVVVENTVQSVVVDSFLKLSIESGPSVFSRRNTVLACGGLGLAGLGLLWKDTAPKKTNQVRHAIVALNANLRNRPSLDREAIVGNPLPFGEPLEIKQASGDFYLVTTNAGEGFISQELIGSAIRVKALIGQNPAVVAQRVLDTQRVNMLVEFEAIAPSVLSASVFEIFSAEQIENFLKRASPLAPADLTDYLYFKNRALFAANQREFGDVVVFSRAAAMSNPAAVNEVHAWGLTSLKVSTDFDPSCAFHAFCVSPRSTSTWVLLAGANAVLNRGVDNDYALRCLRVCKRFSKSTRTTQRFLSELANTTRIKPLADSIRMVLNSW